MSAEEDPGREERKIESMMPERHLSPGASGERRPTLRKDDLGKESERELRIEVVIEVGEKEKRESQSKKVWKPSTESESSAKRRMNPSTISSDIHEAKEASLLYRVGISHCGTSEKGKVPHDEGRERLSEVKGEGIVKDDGGRYSTGPDQDDCVGTLSIFSWGRKSFGAIRTRRGLNRCGFEDDGLEVEKSDVRSSKVCEWDILLASACQYEVHTLLEYSPICRVIICDIATVKHTMA